jgi:exodeoxyribonuclease-5
VETVVHGVADAVAFDDDGKPEVVIDWKSDRDPSEATWEAYREQVRAYVEALGAKEGWIVSTTMGRVERCVVRA